MRVLFCMGEKSADGRVFVRPSARCIAIEGDRVAMVHSLQYDYYKFPGGGIEPQETREQALVRETQEEAGLLVIPDSIREFGCWRLLMGQSMTALCRTTSTTCAGWSGQRSSKGWTIMRHRSSLRWNGCSQSGQSK